MIDETQRAAFEAQMLYKWDESSGFEIGPIGLYLSGRVQFIWEMWQAATAQATAAELEQCALVCDDVQKKAAALHKDGAAWDCADAIRQRGADKELAP